MTGLRALDAASALSSKRLVDLRRNHGPRPGPVLWAILKARLLAIVRMQKQWGNLHDLYDARDESRFVVSPLPDGIRDPDSNFSAIWDITQVVLLLYVSLTVPLRTDQLVAPAAGRSAVILTTSPLCPCTVTERPSAVTFNP